MPVDYTFSRNDSGHSRFSRSPYTQQPDVRLREDSQGNIEGVEYLAGSSGYDSEGDYEYHLRKPSMSSVSRRRSERKRESGDSRRSSQTSSHRPRIGGHRQTYPRSNSNTNSVSSSIRLCPSPGRRPSAQFTLSSPETSGKDESTDDDDDDVPKLSLPECYIPRPRRSIGKSPLLNRDLLRLVNDAGAGDVVELEPMVFALSMSEVEVGHCARGRNGCSEETRPSNNETVHQVASTKPQEALVSGPETKMGEKSDACKQDCHVAKPASSEK